MQSNQRSLQMKKLYTEEYIAANNIVLPLSATCSRCGQTKHRQEFSIQKRPSGKLNIHVWCIDCNSANKLRLDKQKRIDDPLSIYPYTSYTSVQQRTTNSPYSSAASIQKNYQQQSYLKKDIKLLITKEEWVKFWNDSSEIVYNIINLGGIPSVDRIDKLKDYQLDNIRIISQERNLLLKFEKYEHISDAEAIGLVKESTEQRKKDNARRYKQAQNKEKN